MIKINLLPPQYKYQLENNKMRFPIFAILFLSLSILLLSIGIILIAQNLQKNTLTAFENQNEAYEKYLDGDNNKIIEEEIGDIEKLSHNVEIALDNKTDWVDILAEFSQKVPDGITINLLSADKTDKKIEVTGIATDRQKLIAYEQELIESEYFENIILPDSYLISPNNITFKLSVSITEDKI